MKHRYYPREMQTGPVTETIEAVCPICHGTNTLEVGLDEFNPDYAIYVCYECEIEFKVHEPILYMRRQTC